MPFKRRKVLKLLRSLDIHFHPGRGKGSHGMLRRANDEGRSYTIPTHGDLGDRYLEGLCRTFQLDLEETVAQLRGAKKRRRKK